MSERNGDKARFGRERKRKILRRLRIRALWQEFENRNSKSPLAATPAK